MSDLDHSDPSSGFGKGLTCNWCQNHPKNRQWRDGEGDHLLWMSADPSCRKSVLARFSVDEELVPRSSTSTACSFFFKDNYE